MHSCFGPIRLIEPLHTPQKSLSLTRLQSSYPEEALSRCPLCKSPSKPLQTAYSWRQRRKFCRVKASKSGDRDKIVSDLQHEDLLPANAEVCLSVFCHLIYFSVWQLWMRETPQACMDRAKIMMKWRMASPVFPLYLTTIGASSAFGP